MDRITGRWTNRGLELSGNKFNIPSREMSNLISIWLEWLPRITDFYRPELGFQEAREFAFKVAAVKAVRAVYNDVPTASEMDKQLSLRSRKLEVFYKFARFLYLEGKLPCVCIERCALPST
jgi:hypothetical protein